MQMDVNSKRFPSWAVKGAAAPKRIFLSRLKIPNIHQSPVPVNYTKHGVVIPGRACTGMEQGLKLLSTFLSCLLSIPSAAGGQLLQSRAQPQGLQHSWDAPLQVRLGPGAAPGWALQGLSRSCWEWGLCPGLLHGHGAKHLLLWAASSSKTFHQLNHPPIKPSTS